MPKARIDDPLTADQLRALLDYNPETGVLTWRARQGKRRNWDTRRSGKSAGSFAGGYIRVTLHLHRYQAHQLAWLWMTGEWPPARIDHIDTNRANNRWANLRLATNSQNKMNARVRADNTSGYKGVHWVSRERKWLATITVDGVKKRLGLFHTPSEAHAAYREAATRLHGEFARFA
jgi:hypothetical protein